MGLKRGGVLLGGVGVGVTTLSAILVGVVIASTEALCPGFEPSYAVESIDLLRLSVVYTDGCNRFLLNPLVTGGSVLTVSGVVVGAAGVVRELRAET